MSQNSALYARFGQVKKQINQIILGKSGQIDLALACLLARGHLLLEDLPGSGKTTLAKALAGSLALDYCRIQCTSDLLPADVVGFNLLNSRDEKQFVFHKGAIFTNVLLADEINRASPKSQSALLEAMEERQVSVDGHSYPLELPFFVIATQNPLESAGTFPLPEAQLDRFLISLSLGYPAKEDEIRVLSGESRDKLLKTIKAILSKSDVIALQNAVDSVLVSDSIAKYVQALLDKSRKGKYFAQGLSTRAGLGLIRMAKAMAFSDNRNYLLPEDVRNVFVPVVWHRLHNNNDNNAVHMQKINSLLAEVAVPL